MNILITLRKDRNKSLGTKSYFYSTITYSHLSGACVPELPARLGFRQVLSTEPGCTCGQALSTGLGLYRVRQAIKVGLKK